MSGIQPRDCMDLFTRGQGSSGVYYIQPQNVDRPFLAYCDVTDGGGWTVRIYNFFLSKAIFLNTSLPMMILAASVSDFIHVQTLFMTLMYFRS